MADAPALDLLFAGELTDSGGDLLYATIDDFDPAAVQELDEPPGWRVYFSTAAQRDRAASAIAHACGAWVNRIAPIQIPDDDWARRSQAQLAAVQVGRIIVSPPWDPAASRGDSGDAILIVIEPSTGFGTGHHPTTRLCLDLLQRGSLEGRPVIDAGTGSGVLAIAAARLGAASVLAFDRDPDAVRSARENVVRNDVTGVVEVCQQDVGTLSGRRPAELVIANLTGAALHHHADVLCGATRPGGSLIVSGVAPHELPAFERRIGSAAVQSLLYEGWAAARFTVRPRGT